MDKTKICNLALRRLGAPNTVSDIDVDTTAEANALNDVWENCLNYVLSENYWSFAKKVQELAEASEDPTLADWEYAYQIPNDCLEIRRLAGNNKYEVFGDKIHTDAEGDDAYVIYTQEIDDPEDIPTKVASALAWNLAINIAVTVLGDRKGLKIAEYLQAKYEDDLNKAISSDINQENNPADDSEEYITDRE